MAVSISGRQVRAHGPIELDRVTLHLLDEASLLPQAATNIENKTEVLSESLIDPEQVHGLRLLIVGRYHACRPSIFTVPGVSVLMSEQKRQPPIAQAPVVPHRCLRNGVDGTLIVLQGETGQAIAQAQEEMKLPIIAQCRRVHQPRQPGEIPFRPARV